MLSKMCQLIQSAQSFGIITPFKEHLSDFENNDRFMNLKKIVRSAGFGSIVLSGGFTTGPFHIQEKSIFIANLKKKNILKWGSLFDQFSVIYKDEHEFIEIGCNDKTGYSDIKNNFLEKGWNNNIAFTSDLAQHFFTQIAMGSYRGTEKKSSFSDFFLTELIPLSFNERVYHGKKSGDETRISLIINQKLPDFQEHKILTNN